ncbi:MAG: hypothetical protein Q4B01_09530 [Eubacteriales bacterium]|nr:hypothetical protein [Eubacteriales bacterium]
MKKIKTAVIFLTMMLVIIGSTFTVSAKKYYSSKQAGFPTNYKTFKQKHIVSVSGNKLTYRDVIIGDSDNGVKTRLGKLKSARITSKTKFYLGEPSRYFNNLRKTANPKWLKKVSKSTFASKLTANSWWDHVVIKNGKVTKAFTNTHLFS